MSGYDAEITKVTTKMNKNKKQIVATLSAFFPLILPFTYTQLVNILDFFLFSIFRFT